MGKNTSQRGDAGIHCIPRANRAKWRDVQRIGKVTVPSQKRANTETATKMSWSGQMKTMDVEAYGETYNG